MKTGNIFTKLILFDLCGVNNFSALTNLDTFSIVKTLEERNFPQGSLSTQLKTNTVSMCLLYIMLHNHLVSII